MIDETDRRIILALLSNPRSSFREIARKIGLSTGTVISRIEELRNEGTIKPSVILDFKRFNLKLAIFEIYGHIDMVNEIREMDGLILLFLPEEDRVVACFVVRDKIDVLHIEKKIKTISEVRDLSVKLTEEFFLENRLSEYLLNNCSNSDDIEHL